MPFLCMEIVDPFPCWRRDLPDSPGYYAGWFYFPVSDDCHATWRCYLHASMDRDYLESGLVADRLRDERDAVLAAFPALWARLEAELIGRQPLPPDIERAAERAAELYDHAIAFYMGHFRSPKRGAPPEVVAGGT